MKPIWPRLASMHLNTVLAPDGRSPDSARPATGKLFSAPATEDLFMAWHYARYIGKVAEAGKAEYNLPILPTQP